MLVPGSHIGRIRVDALLGAGGMGEVYQGFDERLERPVALKLIHAEKRLTPAMRARFVREAKVLSKLDHPNICRIYDVVEREDGDYLVLELVEGETLRDRTARGLSPDDAVGIAVQIARVLAVAHGRGIIHRDLKPDNVMITKAGEVKVLDFGLARLVEQERWERTEAVDFAVDDVQKTAVLLDPDKTTDPASGETSVGSLVGTLHYMSPEQARGLPLTEASDVYSLGIVLYELLTGGQSPYGFRESTSELLLSVRQAQVAEPPFRDRALRQLFTRMTALQPGERPDAPGVVKALERVRTRPARVKQRVIAAAIAIAFVVLGVGGFFTMRRERGLFDARSTGRVAVLPFRNATNDRALQWVELGLMDLVARGLDQAKGVEVVATADVVRTLRDLRIDRRNDLADTQRQRLLDALGADVLIDATVSAHDEGKYAIRYAALGRDRVESPREVASSMVTEAARQVSLRLAERVDPQARGAAERYSFDHFANTAYAMGQQEMSTRGPKIARSYFAVAVDRDPDFHWARLALAACDNAVGNIKEAEALIDEVQRSARSRGDQHMVAAALIGRAEWENDRGDYARAEEHASEGLALARKIGDRSLQVSAMNGVGYAMWRSGRLDQARQMYEEALRDARALRDIRREAKLHNNLGVLEQTEKNHAATRRHYERALPLAERLGDRVLLATITGNLAIIAGDEGDYRRAEAMTRRQIAIAHDIGDRETETNGWTNLGLWLFSQGRVEEAIAATERARDTARPLAEKRMYALILSNLAVVKTMRGDLRGAEADVEAAVGVISQTNDPETAAEVYIARAYWLTRAGRLAEAERELEKAEKWKVVSRTLMYRGRIAYARGQYARAAELIARAKATNYGWIAPYETMLVAFAESAKTGRPSTVEFELPVRN